MQLPQLLGKLPQASFQDQIVNDASWHISISAFFQQSKHSEHAKAKIVSSLLRITIAWIIFFVVFVFVFLVPPIFIFFVLFRDRDFFYLLLLDFTSIFID